MTYLVAYLSYRAGSNLDFDMIWEHQAVSEQLEELMRAWAQDISQVIRDSARGRNITEWAKKEECWQATKALDLEIPQELLPELRRDHRLWS